MFKKQVNKNKIVKKSCTKLHPIEKLHPNLFMFTKFHLNCQILFMFTKLCKKTNSPQPKLFHEFHYIYKTKEKKKSSLPQTIFTFFTVKLKNPLLNL